MNEKFKSTLRTAVVVIFVGLVILTLADFNERTETLHRLEGEFAAISTEVKGLEDKKAELEAAIQHASSDAAIEAQAYEKWRYTKGDEVLVVPIPVGEPMVTPIPTPAVTTEPLTSLEVWGALFNISP